MTQYLGDTAVKTNSLVHIATGVSRVDLQTSETVINETGVDIDTRVEGDTDANLVFVDASTDRVGIGKAAPAVKFDVEGVIGAKAGLSSSVVKVGGTLFSYNSDVGNSGTSETDLYTDSILASTLGADKDKLEARYAGEMVSSATATRQLKVYFGGTAIFDTGALSLSASSDWDLEVLIIRVSSSVVRYTCKLNLTGASLSAYCNVGELTGLTLSNANTFKITGQAAGVGAATNDIVARLGSVQWLSAP